MLLADTSFWDVLWWMLVFFFWVMFFWIFITVVADIFRRDDIGGGKKAMWIVLVIFLPLIGILAYMIARPKMTAQDVQMITRAQAAERAAAGVSTADELTKLKQLHDAGVIDDAEYAKLKGNLLA